MNGKIPRGGELGFDLKRRTDIRVGLWEKRERGNTIMSSRHEWGRFVKGHEKKNPKKSQIDNKEMDGTDHGGTKKTWGGWVVLRFVGFGGQGNKIF